MRSLFRSCTLLFQFIVAIGGKNLTELLNAPPELFANVTPPSGDLNGTNTADQLQNLLNDENSFNNIFKNYQKIYKKDTTKDDEDLRKSLLKSQMLEVYQHNLLANNGQASYERGINQFSDMTSKEVVSQYTGFQAGNSTRPTKRQTKFLGQLTQIVTGGSSGDTVNWKAKGMVSSVKNQGKCGSCALFSITAALESFWKIQHGGSLLDLSEQELLDCIPMGEGHGGCGVNTLESTMEYQKSHGQGLETDFPYTQKEGACKQIAPVASIKEFQMLPVGDELTLKNWVAIAPVVTAFHVSPIFQSYKRGVYTDPINCGGKGVTHAVLTVGYGTELGMDYWLAKNSWGSTWGDSGYFKIRRNYNNFCEYASYAASISN